MITATKLASQGNDIRQIQSESPLWAIIAKAIGSLHENAADAPPLTREQWLAAISDLQGVAQSDLLAFTADQLARTFLPGGSPGLSVTGSAITLSADTAFKLLTPFVVSGTSEAGAPLALMNAVNGTVEFAAIGERFLLASYEAVSASRNIANADLGKTLVYSGTSNITLTIPAGLVAGMKFRVIQASSGKVTIAGSGVTVNGKNGHLSTGGAWHVIDVTQAGATQFVVYGDTAA